MSFSKNIKIANNLEAAYMLLAASPRGGGGFRRFALQIHVITVWVIVRGVVIPIEDVLCFVVFLLVPVQVEAVEHEGVLAVPATLLPPLLPLLASKHVDYAFQAAHRGLHEAQMLFDDTQVWWLLPLRGGCGV